jgi:hypothetical protein
MLSALLLFSLFLRHDHRLSRIKHHSHIFPFFIYKYKRHPKREIVPSRRKEMHRSSNSSEDAQYQLVNDQRDQSGVSRDATRIENSKKCFRLATNQTLVNYLDMVINLATPTPRTRRKIPRHPLVVYQIPDMEVELVRVGRSVRSIPLTHISPSCAVCNWRGRTEKACRKGPPSRCDLLLVFGTCAGLSPRPTARAASSCWCRRTC